jgi:hypothetical protein
VAKLACQCGVTGICTCGDSCPCDHPKAGVAKAPANPTVIYRVTSYRQEPIYAGPFQRVVVGYRSVPYVTESTTPPNGYVQSVTTLSTSYPTSQPKPVVRQSTPVSSASSTTPNASPVAMRRVCSGGRCYLVPQ